MAKRKTITQLSDLQPDTQNANRGTERGRYLVEASLTETGAGRSIVADKDGRIIAGNKTLEAWAGMGGAVKVVETDGNELVVVQRTDLDLSDPNGKARKLAYYDNRAGQVGLEWDAEQLLADVNAGVDLAAMFKADEIEALLSRVSSKDGFDFDNLPTEDRPQFQQMTFTLHDTQAERVKAAVSKASRNDFSGSPNANGNGNALAFVCEAFLNANG